MADDINNNKRIAKNTAMLYIRMLLTMCITLYTSRVVLHTLGVSDYGVYNIVGGVVVLFSFINNALTSATQRYLNFGLGRNDIMEVKKIFSTCFFSFVLIIVVCFILSETIGLWFVYYKLTIPSERLEAALWVYQLSVLAFIFNIIRTPFQAAIIAEERMDFYAYISIAETGLKLLIVYLLLSFSYDKLILYALLTTFVTGVILLLYVLYSKKHFQYIFLGFRYDPVLIKEIFSFSGWTLYGNLSNIVSGQGLNILLNLFYGVTVNAAMGVANQISSAVFGFVGNFQTAFNPQLTKLYATGEIDNMKTLIYRASKISYILLLIISIPFIFNTPYVIRLWLGVVPEYVVVFSQLILVDQYFFALSGPLWTSAQATGKISKYMIMVGNFNICTLIISYMALKLGIHPEGVLVCKVVIDAIVYIYRLCFLQKYLDLNLILYVRQTLLPVVLVTLLSVPLPYYLNNQLTESFFNLIVKIGLTVVSIAFISFIVGFNKQEKIFVMNIFKSKFKK